MEDEEESKAFYQQDTEPTSESTQSILKGTE